MINSIQKFCNISLRITGSQKDAENLTEKVFREVNNSLYTFKGKSSLPTWIYRIATNAALDKMRRLSFKKGPAPDDKAIQTEVNSCIRKIMEEIPGTYKIALVLSELEGLKNREIGSVLDLNPDTVTFRLHRTREKIRKKLKARFELFGTDINGYTYDLKSVFGDPKE